MNKPTSLPRASHVNHGTSGPHDAELPWPKRRGTVLRHTKLHIEQDERPDVTALGGLALPLALMRRFDMPAILDHHVTGTAVKAATGWRRTLRRNRRRAREHGPQRAGARALPTASPARLGRHGDGLLELL